MNLYDVDAELARLRAALAERDGEVERLRSELERAHATNRLLHRRTQAAESDENERAKPLREQLRSLEWSRKFAREFLETNGINDSWMWSNVARNLFANVLDEKRALEAEVATLRAQNLAHCERIAAQSDALGRAAEKDATGRLEAWVAEDETGWKREAAVSFVGCWRVRLIECSTAGRLDVEAFAKPNGRTPLVNDRYHEIHVGTDDQPATLAACVDAALAKWAELYKEG